MAAVRQKLPYLPTGRQVFYLHQKKIQTRRDLDFF